VLIVLGFLVGRFVVDDDDDVVDGESCSWVCSWRTDAAFGDVEDLAFSSELLLLSLVLLLLLMNADLRVRERVSAILLRCSLFVIRYDSSIDVDRLKQL
jgi:hypothetical protein